MIRFMGNGKRIENVMRTVCSDCITQLYHVPSQDSSICDGLAAAVHFMTEHGFKDVFLLELEQRGDI
jgi:hypothetical protein